MPFQFRSEHPDESGQSTQLVWWESQSALARRRGNLAPTIGHVPHINVNMPWQLNQLVHQFIGFKSASLLHVSDARVFASYYYERSV